MSGSRSRDKGNRTERAVVRLLQAQGIAATKISGMYKPGADLHVPLLGVIARLKSNAAPQASASFTTD